METRTTALRTVFRKNGCVTDAEVTASLAGEEFSGWGRARQNPDDRQPPEVVDELALARALADLSDQLLDRACEGHSPVKALRSPYPLGG
jgi:hypothetical protein